MKKKPLVSHWKQLHKKHIAFLMSLKEKHWLWRVLAIGVTFGVFVGVLFFGYVLITLPDITDLNSLEAVQSSEIYDRNGKLLYTIQGDENRINVSLDQIAQQAVDAVLAIEDDQFYHHFGIDIPAIMKALCHEMLLCPTARGGSTLTQQFIKNTFLTNDRRYTRKAREIVAAILLERRYSKDEILQFYLNRIPYGSSIYGIERAANRFLIKALRILIWPKRQ
ncbi:penicillin-binding protein [Candidatus Peregrinibacteria bacterium]|nr:MAG: penicillin-binding protein [Candidatus Peregrinibacteria bacterium]